MGNTDSLFDLSGRVAIITGGAGLLGQMHAEAIAAAGGWPVITDVRQDAASDVARAIKDTFGTPALAVGCDITRREDVLRLRDVVLKELSRIDILINNAAIDPKVGPKGDAADRGPAWSRFEHFPIEAWMAELAVGLTGSFLCAQVLGAVMAERRSGTIINISSDLGVIAPDQRLYRQAGIESDRQPVKPVTYSVIKTGLIGLTRYLATYWADRGVRANALCPAGVEAGQPEDFKERIHKLIPMGRMAKRDEYKGAIQFLASDASSYMTGAVLVIDGGRTCW